MLKVKVKVKGHVIRALSWILGMSYSVIDGLVRLSNVDFCTFFVLHLPTVGLLVVIVVNNAEQSTHNVGLRYYFS